MGHSSFATDIENTALGLQPAHHQCRQLFFRRWAEQVQPLPAASFRREYTTFSDVGLTPSGMGGRFPPPPPPPVLLWVSVRPSRPRRPAPISEDQLLVSARPAPCLIEEALSFTTRRKSGGAKQWYCSQTVIGSGGQGGLGASRRAPGRGNVNPPPSIRTTPG